MKNALGLLVITSLFGADTREWKIGKVLDAQAAKSYLQSGSSTSSSAAGTAVQTGGSTTLTTQGSSNTTVHNIVIRSTQLMIAGQDYAYVVDDDVERAVGPTLHGSLRRAIANRKHGCRYVVGDPIQYSQTKNTLYVRDADGKECKLTIDRQERLQTALNPK